MSLLLIRKFSGRKYWILVIAVALMISSPSTFGRVETHQRTDFTFKTAQYYTISPVPLSFPFYVSVFYDFTVRPLPIDGSRFTYQISFLTFEITRVTTLYPYPLTLATASAYLAFFLAVNIVGPAIVYWVSKSSIVKRYFGKPHTINNSHLPISENHSYS